MYKKTDESKNKASKPEKNDDDFVDTEFKEI